MGEKLNLIQLKCDIMNGISAYFSDKMFRMRRQYRNQIPYEVEKSIYDEMLSIKSSLKTNHGIDIENFIEQPEE